MAPLVLTWYWRITLPDRNTALPEADTAVNTVRALALASRSPMRPPQPSVAPSGPSACQVLCWSLWEKSRAGTATLPALYCALVRGAISGPTLGTMARRRSLSNIVCRLLISGCSAKLRPCGRAGAIGSTPPRRAGEPASAAGIAGVPAGSSAIESGAWLRVRV